MQQLDLFGFPIETPAPKKKEKAVKASEASAPPVQAKTVTVIPPSANEEGAPAPVEIRPTASSILPPPADAIYAKEEMAEPAAHATETVPQEEPMVQEGAAPGNAPAEAEAVVPVVAATAQEPMEEPALPVTETVPAQEEFIREAIAPVVESAKETPSPVQQEEIVAPATIVATTGQPPAEESKTKKAAATVKTGKRGRKSFKEMDSEADLVEVPDDETLQKKLYYSISEVAGWFKVNTSLLRYWENEFDVLQPRKTRKGDRLFRVEDIKNLQLIYFLLRQRKFSIDGAKNYLKNNRQEADTQIKLVESLTKFRSFLLEMKGTLQA